MDFSGVANQEIQSLISEGIQLWSTSQEVLEQQALKELEILAEEARDKQPPVIFDLKKASPEEHEPNSSEHESNSLEPDPNSPEPDDDSGSDYIPSDAELAERQPTRRKKGRLKTASKRKPAATLKVTDDALEENYQARLEQYYTRLEQELQAVGPSEGKDYKKLKGGLKAPKDAWNKLYEYQKEGVYWLWELHQRSSGGLLGDEMGLGKTVQIIAFFHALQYSRPISNHCKYVGLGPTIIVCPATVIHQWVKHFHEWSPEFRVVVLHQSGTHQGQKAKLIAEGNRNKAILITTYAAVLKYKGNLCEHSWHYLVLDEGHIIRNPSAKVTVAVKELRTPHRIMLTGSPMQNNLTELWSLFDFTNPGMLGNLAVFTEHFANPILQGGFANASPMQEATALSVASTLKNVISPFLLRRMKTDVKDHIQLPHKSEQVLFCSLTEQQRDIYKDYLMSEHVNNILGRGAKRWRSENFMKGHLLMAITALRKICNHPDLFIHDEGDDVAPEENFGNYKNSGKMVVVSALLKIWRKQGHRTLLFSQGRIMLRIFEACLQQHGYKYLKMDGATSVGSRQGLIDTFNQDVSYQVFLLTTRVGGLGVNLTGANRVIIYDPDWNPATDSQARERAWRIGQDRPVTIYRLLCAGTVEEKMYQRQVWKQLLSNKVLIDPTTNKFFKSSDLFDLFSLPESPKASIETANIFRESRVKIMEKIKRNETPDVDESEKVRAMRALARKISQSLTKEPAIDAYRLELEEERQQKLQEKAKLKHLTAQELVEFNRLKTAVREDEDKNTLDGDVAGGSFEEALERSSKSAALYRKITTKQIRPSELKALKAKGRKRRCSMSPDTSGKIDGQLVKGLVKRETKAPPKRHKPSKGDYILEHLFSKKGVAAALEHESVLRGGQRQQSLKVRSHADEKAVQALDALKKSRRLKEWKW
ncbi:DNA excision repair protein ERCC-6 [Dendroctonus ponderosae]|uniref:DNA excision repair protein ERCC-6 n=1 Tax=Dendroctonus ponderosae TaxID=77166 RepID=UPI0020352D58|nr:DNA excision repair protein ERCC-6 [Dendroctonus ponderosae]KAH1006602.1 hypothetical protein HUJ05_007317 [Dendroctonus ponderosae]